MNHKKNLSDFARELVSNYAKYLPTDEFHTLNTYDIPLNEREELAVLYLEAEDRNMDIVIEAILKGDFSIDSEFMVALLDMLKNHTSDNRDNFACIVVSNMLVYLDDKLQDVINDACRDYDYDLKEAS